MGSDLAQLAVVEELLVVAAEQVEPVADIVELVGDVAAMTVVSSYRRHLYYEHDVEHCDAEIVDDDESCCHQDTCIAVVAVEYSHNVVDAVGN